jgi:uncharacterized phage protein gp47/JayE
MAVEDITSTETEDELYERFCTDAATLDYPVDVRGMQPERWAPGQLHVEAKSHEQYQLRRKDIVESGWRQTALGDSLTQFGRGFHTVERFGATYATHQIRLTDTGAGATAIPAGDRVAYSSNGQEFRNTAIVNVPVGSYVDAEFKAEVAGADGNVSAGAITAFRAPIVGIAVSNPAIGSTGSSLITAGRDAETDTQFGARLDDHWGSVGSGGNDAAYRWWVHESFTVDGLTSTITRIKVLSNNPYGFGSIGVVIANAAGTATAGELTRVDDYLQLRKALGSGELRVEAATSQTVLVSGTVYVSPAYDTATVLIDVQDALDDYESEFSIGGLVYRAEVIQRVMAVAGVYNFECSDPVSDTVIGPTSIVGFDYSALVAQA